MHFRSNYLLLIGFLSLLGSIQNTGAVFAQNQLTHFLYAANNRQAGISQQEAAAIAQRYVNGRILSISRSSSNYRVKILNNKGNIQVVTVSASDGTVLSTR
jgi:uncharacterized membrane protein YkoI